MKKNRLIVVEGPQGTGKTTLTNFLRDNIPSANLYRLSGQKDKTLKGKEYSTKMYFALIDYLKSMQQIPMDLIFDRTFFTEEVYSRLGYKDYSFHDVYEEILDLFCELDFDIYYISLYLQKEELFEKRLKRDSHHQYQSFSLDSSVNQQNVYKEISSELKNTSVHVYDMPMDDFEVAYKEICKLLEIKRK